MTQLTSKVIRGDEVKIAGRRQIGCASAGASPAGGQAVASGPVARIMAEDAAGATIEIVCECGKRVYVRCEYSQAGPQPAQERQP